MNGSLMQIILLSSVKKAPYLSVKKENQVVNKYLLLSSVPENVLNVVLKSDATKGELKVPT